MSCKIFCCDACVIDFHAIHILQAKYKVEEIFKQIRTEIEELKGKISGGLKIQGNTVNDLDNYLSNQLKNINNNHKIKEASLITIKKRIDDILKIEKEINNKLNFSLEEYFKEESIEKTDKISCETKERKILIINK